MPYYPTLAEDIERAKAILAEGRSELVPGLEDAERELDPAVDVEHLRRVAGGTIFGKDTYAAYKLLESFVEVIEAVDVKVCELALRHRTKVAALAQHLPGCTCIIVNGEYRSTETAGCPHHPPGTRVPFPLPRLDRGADRCDARDAAGRRCLYAAFHADSMNATPHLFELKPLPADEHTEGEGDRGPPPAGPTYLCESCGMSGGFHAPGCRWLIVSSQE